LKKTRLSAMRYSWQDCCCSNQTSISLQQLDSCDSSYHRSLFLLSQSIGSASSFAHRLHHELIKSSATARRSMRL